MSVPTAPQLAIIRRPQQSTDLYLAVYQPPVVEHGRVFPDALIQGLPSELADNYYIAGFTATNVATSGTVKNGMTLVFGSAAGKEDLGRTFVRGKSGNHYDFSVIENMPLVSGLYYRVYDFFELWPVFPRVTVDGSNIITYYKDYSKPYTNQNSIFTPVAVVGPNSAAYVDDATGQKTMTFVATGSYTVDGTAISNTYWEINTSPPTILTGSTVSYTFPRSGNYTIETRVVNANAITGTAHRHYILLNREGKVKSVYNPPIKDWKFEGLDGDWNSGGWQCKFSLGEDADDLRDGALVVIFAEDIYGNGAPQSFGGYADRENILFSGYIDKVETKNDWQTSRSTFSAKSAINLLQNRDMFSVSLETSPNPVDWTQIQNMTINKIIDHYLRWHSTFFDVCDYRPLKNTTAGDYPEQYEDIPRGEIFTNVKNIMANRLLANFVSDKQGRVFSEVDMNCMITGSRPATAVNFQVGDWIDKLKTVEDLEYRSSSVLLGGVAYDTALNTGSAYLSRAPDALFPLHFGKAETKSGLTIDSQSTLNNLSGLYLAVNNSRFPSLGMTLANNMRTIDIIPQEFYQLPTDYPFNDQDYRNLKYVWENRRMLPRRINYSLKENTLTQEIVYETETYGPPGETVRIPAQPPNNGTPTPQEPPGIIPAIDPPGLGNLVWEVTSVTGTIYDVKAYGDYIFVTGDKDGSPQVWRTEKRRKSDGGLEWAYDHVPFAAGTAQGRAVYVDSDGIFVAGGESAGAFVEYSILEIDDNPAPTMVWRRFVSYGFTSSLAHDLIKLGSYVFAVGANDNGLGSTDLIVKLLASDGTVSSSNNNVVTNRGIDDNGSQLYIGGSSKMLNWTTNLVENWNKSASLQGRSIRTKDGYSYHSIGDVTTDVVGIEKRQNNDGSLVWTSTYNVGTLGTILKAKSDVGDNFVFFPLGVAGGATVYQLNKSNGSSFTAYTSFATPLAVRLDSSNLYIVGKNSGNLWTIQKRSLPYT